MSDPQTSAREVAPAQAFDVGASVASWTLFILFLSNLVSVADRALLGVVTEPVRVELGLSDTEMSLANGLLFVAFNLVAGIFIARLVDRGNRKRILIVGVLGWSIATAATAYATDFATLSLARVAVGIGEATVFPVALSLISDIFRPIRRAGAVAVFQSSNFVGVVGGTIIAGVFAAALGWRNMFIVCGAAGAVLAALVTLTVREPQRETERRSEVEPVADYFVDLIRGARRILSTPGFVPLALGFGFSATLGATLGAWGPAFLQRLHHVPLARVGLVIGPPVGIGGICGMIFSGLLANYVVKRTGRQLDMVRIPIVTLPLALPFIIGFVFSSNLTVAMVSAGAMNFLLSCAAAPSVTLAVGLVAPTDRGLTSTLLLASSGLLGGALGPFIVGLISDLLTATQDAEGLRYGLSFLITVPVFSTLALVFAWRTGLRRAAALA